jgi:hypothetical protein
MLSPSVSINDYYTFPPYEENRYMFQWLPSSLLKLSMIHICKNVKYYICCQFCFGHNDYEPI